MATFDLGRVTPLYKGDYSASASYELNDVVLYNGNLYWHVQVTATVGILPTDTTVWKLAFADEGVRAEIRGYADNAQNSADSALASKSAAAQSSSQASASESHAALSAQTAQTAETVATASAQTASTKASEATASAQSAASSAQIATDKATLATNKAQAASESATLATAKANAAATSETNATTAAQTATTKASEAAASATSAQEYDESAQQSAVNAQASATNAAASEAAAKSYAEDSAAYLGAYPTDTAEGEIASFPDGADDVPMVDVLVNIDPVQDLSHGEPSPGNICPISGWNGVNVSHSGADTSDATVYPITFPTEAGTVYGGTLDVTTGELVVNMAMVDLGTLAWVINDTRFKASVNGMPNKEGRTIKMLCDCYKSLVNGDAYDKNVNNVCYGAYGGLYVHDSAYTNASIFKTAVTGHQLVYELATPITYQLTPTEVKSLLGANNIFADTGDITVEYRADTSAYIAKKIAEAISALS